MRWHAEQGRGGASFLLLRGAFHSCPIVHARHHACMLVLEVGPAVANLHAKVQQIQHGSVCASCCVLGSVRFLGKRK